MAKGDVIYHKYDNSEQAYILRKGSVIYEVIEGYEFIVECTERIFGASEILMQSKYQVPESRHFTLKETDICEFSAIPTSNLLQWITEYNIGWNAGKHIAETITRLHGIVLSLEEEVKDLEKVKNKLLGLYASLVNILKDEALLRNEKWFIEFVNDLMANEMYSMGVQFVEISSKVEIDKSNSLDKFKKVYQEGDYICKKGEEADSLYILSSGKIRVMIDDETAVGIIDEKGSIIGEMAILLNDRRTADMRAIEETTLIAIKRNEIRDLFKSEQDVFMSMLTNLAMREAYNCNYVSQLHGIVTKDSEEREKYLEDETKKYRNEIILMKERIEEVKEKHKDHEWVGSVYNRFLEKLSNTKI